MQCQKLKTYMETGRVIFLPVRSIHPNPAQPRKLFRQDALEELAESIRIHGILQPLSVRRTDNYYELIAGERRLRAASLAGLSEMRPASGVSLAGLSEIPCIVMTMDEKESGMAAMIENLQRQDLDFIDEARGISNLMHHWNMSQEQISRVLGKSQSAVANKLRLLRHSDGVLNALRAANLTERHARALLKLHKESDKLNLIQEITTEHLSVAQTERRVQNLLSGAGSPAPSLQNLLQDISTRLTKIQQLGIHAVTERKETENHIVLTITIPKKDP